MLPIAMAAGASGYLLYHAVPALHRFGPLLSGAVGVIQPFFIFAMLCLICPTATAAAVVRRSLRSSVVAFFAPK